VAGGVVEYSITTPGASPSGMTAGPDGNLWFVDTGDQYRVVRVTPSGVITGFAVPGSVGGPQTIAAGADGNVWMVASGGGTGAESWILRVNPKGVVTRFSLPGAGPDGITWGPDGNLWFTEFFRNTIGRMTPAGVLLGEFRIPGIAPRGIVTGPDGNLWFTEADPNGGSIARMTPAGAVTQFPLLESNSNNQADPTAIVVGPDRNIWFTEASGGKLGRITTAGVITEFRLPGTGNPQGLTVGPDGNLWFTVSGGTVGRITPNGTMRLFALPGRNSQPIGIAAGSDGRIWFTEAGVNRVGSIGETVPEVGLKSPLLSFGTEASPATRTVSVTNTGDAPLSITSVKIAGSEAAAFSIGRDTCGGRMVASGATCQVDIALAPRPGQGVLTGRLQLADNATGSPQSVSLVAQLPDCRLPAFTRSEGPVVVHGGFIDLSTGAFTPDAGGAFDFDASRGLYRSKAAPVLDGLFPAFYDPVARRWLPASLAAISPDHSLYAYAASNQSIDRQLHVVDIATGGDRVISLPAGPWNVLGFGADGVYLNQSYEGIGQDFTVVNTVSGAHRTVTAGGPVFQVAGGAAWVGAFNTRDSVPPPPSQGPTSNQVVRLDLGTGQVAPWLYVSGASLYVIAVSAGRLLVSGYFRHGFGTWIVSGANQAERITVPGTGEDFAFNAGFVSDANGVWLGGLDGIYLWRPGKGISLVSDAIAAPAGMCM
jgi:streptogramin lyase